MTKWEELKQVNAKAKAMTDIASHLETLFRQTVESRPKLIVELGVKHGCSTFALSRAAIVTGAVLVSVDNRDFSRSLDWDQWIFLQMDDLDFAKQFPTWCLERKIEPSIDVLFIDTDHTYEHTKEVMTSFWPLLAGHAKVMFHDTNCSGIYRRRDFTIDRSYDSQRGVITAIEEYFGRMFNEKKQFEEFIDGWLIRHDPICNGLMTLTRIA